MGRDEHHEVVGTEAFGQGEEIVPRGVVVIVGFDGVVLCAPHVAHGIEGGAAAVDGEAGADLGRKRGHTVTPMSETRIELGFARHHDMETTETVDGHKRPIEENLLAGSSQEVGGKLAVEGFW